MKQCQKIRKNRIEEMKDRIKEDKKKKKKGKELARINREK